MEADVKDPQKAKGGIARAKALPRERRREIGRKAAATRWANAKDVPRADYSGEVKIGELAFPCSVLSDGTRILTQSDFMAGMGMYYSGWVSRNRTEEDAAADIPHFLSFARLKPFVDKHLGDLQSITVSYRTEHGNIARGIRAEIIPKLCDVWLDAEEAGKLGSRQKQVAQKAKLIMRALAHTAIIALVDEATGYQRVRASDELQTILRAFIAKELQPYVSTFPEEFYEQLFRLRGLQYPRDKVKRPRYFGHLTNDIIYSRLAPGLLEELQRDAPRTDAGRLKHHNHRRLSRDLGHPKLRERLSSVTTIMKLSSEYDDFSRKLDRVHPRYNQTIEMDLGDGPDTGIGL